jgi:hypothetical protein
MKCSYITSQENHEEHQEDSQCTQEILQNFLYYPQNVATNTCNKIYNEIMRERGNNERNFGIIDLLWEFMTKWRGETFFYSWERGKTPLGWTPSVTHPREGGHFKGGALLGFIEWIGCEGWVVEEGKHLSQSPIMKLGLKRGTPKVLATFLL